jgi:hypothetical protein
LSSLLLVEGGTKTDGCGAGLPKMEINTFNVALKVTFRV